MSNFIEIQWENPVHVTDSEKGDWFQLLRADWNQINPSFKLELKDHWKKATMWRIVETKQYAVEI